MNKNKLLIGLGLLILGFVWWRSPKLKSGEQKEVEKGSSLPEKFKNDVEKMSKDEIKKAISDNERYLTNAQIQPESRKAIETMLEYLKSKA